MTHWRHSKQASEQFVETMFFLPMTLNIPSMNRWNSFYRWDFSQVIYFQHLNVNLFPRIKLYGVYFPLADIFQGDGRVWRVVSVGSRESVMETFWRLGVGLVVSIQDRCVWQVWGHVVWTQRTIYQPIDLLCAHFLSNWPPLAACVWSHQQMSILDNIQDHAKDGKRFQIFSIWNRCQVFWMLSIFQHRQVLVPPCSYRPNC